MCIRDRLRTFTGVLDAVKQDYVEPVKDKDLLENAIRGMLSNLDPHSAYLDAEAFQDLQIGTSGEFGGLGIEAVSYTHLDVYKRQIVQGEFDKISHLRVPLA